MESSRDDILRVNVDTQADFQRIKADYSRQFLSFVEEQIRTQGLESQRAAMVAHAQQVGFLDLSFMCLISTSTWTEHSQWHKQIFVSTGATSPLLRVTPVLQLTAIGRQDFTSESRHGAL